MEGEFRSKKKEKQSEKEERRKPKRKQKLDVIFLLLLSSVESEGMAFAQSPPSTSGLQLGGMQLLLFITRGQGREVG
jgi:hypothetical protein